ncbi:hypothetical protein B0H13DRAFT_2155377 [Mycena leptocephala]|nr:hypothetical protein B0H13DRAFT_2155377 [Mycena leptocephala]
MCALKTLCAHGTLSRTHRGEHSRIPQLLASLPPALRVKLPRAFLETHGIMVLPAPKNIRSSLPPPLFAVTPKLPSVELLSRETQLKSTGVIAACPDASIDGLVLEYMRRSDTHASLRERTKSIVSQECLALSEIEDRGADWYLSSNWLPVGQFGLETTMASALLQAPCFLVDPHGGLIRTLRGAGSIEELHIAWSALRERMGLARKREHELILRIYACPSER